ncbi:MAG: hypothetical protein E2O76_01980 [Caldithrix sp.]|nr:MAG: hypothetical protein E2O76_01980 [Caldithrix sp.]
MVYKVPIWAINKEETLADFGFELARKFIDVADEGQFLNLSGDENGRIRLNHFGGAGKRLILIS